MRYLCHVRTHGLELPIDTSNGFTYRFRLPLAVPEGSPMNGLVLCALRSHVLEQGGDETWEAICEDVGRRNRLYLPSSDYPDELVETVLDATVERTDADRPSLLTAIGRSIGSTFLSIIRLEVDPDWDALAVVSHLDRVLERAFTHNRHSCYDPPVIECQLVGDRTVFVEFRTKATHCSLYHGLIESIADEYGEPMIVSHRACHTEGVADRCTLVVSSVRDLERATAETAITRELSRSGA